MWIDRPTDPPDNPMPECPICGEGATIIYVDHSWNAVGCNKCIREQDAVEWEEDHKLV